MADKHPTSLILASTSPQRRQLLAEAGYKFKVVRPDIDESSFSTAEFDAYRYAEQLALAKAISVARKYPESVVIGADTIVDFHGQIIGKPVDAEQARQITEKLFSSPHKVITGLAVIKLLDDIELVAHDITVVYPKRLRPEQIEQHINSGSWRDKSGAYAIKQTGDEFIERIDGSLTNVMGLPTELLSRMLRKIY